MKKLTLVLALLSLGCSLSHAAALQSMSSSEVQKTLAGNTITTIPLASLHGNLIQNSASIYLNKNGELLGQFTNKPDNDPQNDQGKWQVKSNGQLCVSWKTWTQDKPLCVYTYKVANGLIFINTDHKFESMVLSDKIQAGNQIHS